MADNGNEAKDRKDYDDYVQYQSYVAKQQLAMPKAAPVNAAAEEISGRAALSGAGQALTLGYLPHLQSMAEGLLPNPTSDVDAKLKAQGFNVPDQPGYVERRDENIKRIEGEAQESPVSYYGGMVGGALLQAPMIGGAAAKIGAKAAQGSKLGLLAPTKGGLAGRVGKSAAAGGLTSLAHNPGDATGKLNPIQINERLDNAKTGVAIGGLAQGGGEALGKIGKAVLSAPAKLKQMSQATAFKAAGPMLKDWREVIGRDKVEELGEIMLKKGMSKPGQSVDDVAEISGKLKQEAGARIGKIYEKVGKSAFSDDEKLDFAVDLQKKLQQAVKDKRPGYASQGYGSRMDDVIAETVDDLENVTDVRHLHEKMSELDRRINYAKRGMGDELPDSQEGYIAIRGVLRKSIDDITDKIGSASGDKALLSKLKEANKEFGNYASINKISTDKVAREGSNRMMGLSEQFGGLGGGMLGAATADSPEEALQRGLIYGAGGAAVQHVGRKFALPVMAQGARALGGLLDAGGRTAKRAKVVGDAASKIPVGIGAASQGLLNQPNKK